MAKCNKVSYSVPKKYIHEAITGTPGVSSAVTKRNSGDKNETEFRPLQTVERHKVEPIPVRPSQTLESHTKVEPIPIIPSQTLERHIKVEPIPVKIGRAHV